MIVDAWCVRGRLPSDVDSQFLQTVSQFESYGVHGYLVTVSI